MELPGSLARARCPDGKALNAARLRGRPQSLASRYHVCRGADLVDARSYARPAVNDALDSEDDRNHSRLGKRRSQVRSAQWAPIGDARIGTRLLVRDCS